MLMTASVKNCGPSRSSAAEYSDGDGDGVDAADAALAPAPRVRKPTSRAPVTYRKVRGWGFILLPLRAVAGVRSSGSPGTREVASHPVLLEAGAQCRKACDARRYPFNTGTSHYMREAESRTDDVRR